MPSADWPAAASEEPARTALDAFVRRLLERNRTLNLTGARDAAAVAEHVADSLAIASFVRAPHVDIGSGGGFPALPLAILTGCPMTLIESVAKKAAWLREIVADLALPVQVLETRAEEAGRRPELRGHFASATARAVGSVPVVLELMLPLLAVGGVAILQRGRLEPLERRAMHDSLLVLGGEIVAEVVPTEPLDERRVLLVRKSAPTNQRFPRRPGVPARRPLCLYDV